MKHYTSGVVQSNQQIASDIFLAEIHTPKIARDCAPAQFVNIYFPDSVKLFPRPFSIAGKKEENILLLYKIVGHQTVLMNRWSNGTEVKLLGPLGNSFDISQRQYTNYILLAGGVGAAPLLFLRDELKAKGISPYFFIGARTNSELPLSQDENSHLFISTDDGSVGFQGTVTEHFIHLLNQFSAPSIVYGCGPEAMLKALKQHNFPDYIDIFVSLEKVMACGLGLCQGCAVRMSKPDGETSYSLVCKDGPVFNLKDVQFDG
jgi:dihydroorotate dehydrogenase electron transfer subunit